MLDFSAGTTMRIPDAYHSSNSRGTFFHLNAVAVNPLRWNLTMNGVFRTVEFAVGKPVNDCATVLSVAIYDSTKEPVM